MISVSRKKSCFTDAAHSKCFSADFIHVCDFPAFPDISSVELVYWIDYSLFRKYVYLQYLEYERVF